MDALIQLSKKFLCHDPFILAKYSHIDIHYTSRLPQNYLGLASPSFNTIFLHENLMESPARFFICAHELHHILEDDGLQPYYNISNKNKRQIEHKANAAAIQLLLLWFFSENDCFNIEILQRFMYNFNLPSDLFHIIENEINNFMPFNN